MASTDTVYITLMKLYHVSIIFITLLCVGILVLTGFWAVYFINNLFLNYTAYKSYTRRVTDEDSQKRKRTKKIFIARDLLILGVISSEFLTSVLLLLEFMSGWFVGKETQNYSNMKFMDNFDCSVNVTGTDSMFVLLHNLGSYGCVVEAVRQSLIITQMGIYWSVVVLLTQVYRSNGIHMRPVYQILSLTLIQAIMSLILISFIQTYILGYPLSILFLSVMVYVVIRATRKLKLQIQFRLQDISLVDDMDARQEHARTKKALNIYKKTATCFTSLLFILVLGEITFCVATVWVEWIVLLQCNKLKPAFLMFTPGERGILAVSYLSMLGRILETVAAISFYGGIIGMSVAVAFQKLLENLRKIRKRRSLYSPLI